MQHDIGTDLPHFQAQEHSGIQLENGYHNNMTVKSKHPL